MPPPSWPIWWKRLREMADLPARFWQHPTRVHLIGIGGVGMAGLARLLLQAGFLVSGSDSHPNRLTRDLQTQGVTFYKGHAFSNLNDPPEWAIRTPAVGEGNPEVDACRALQIPLFVRGQVLAAYANKRRSVAVAGAHGKTTTTAMLATILDHCGVGAGYAVGGETVLPGRVANQGQSKDFVLEADESDGTLVHYAPLVGIMTHVEWDHVDRFRSEASLLRCYRKFAQRCGQLWIREGDLLAECVCAGMLNVCRVGENPSADLQLLRTEDDAEGQRVWFRYQQFSGAFRIPLPGKHNAFNATMAIAAALHLGVSPAQACEGIASFSGVARRFQRQEKNGVTLIQDYAHHPTEIRALMQSVKALNPKRLWLVFQPHRFSRTRHLLYEFAKAFEGADQLGLLPVYAASELPGQGSGSEALAALCRGAFPKVKVFGSREEIVKAWAPQLTAGDVLLIVGAGDVEALQGEFWAGTGDLSPHVGVETPGPGKGPGT
jgi:UDP-N-acetylmuramate--alanine ligase